MTTPLPERYIAATVKDLPAELQAEVRPELEASIADAIEARLDQGQDRATAEREVLTDLGDPAVLAAGYTERPLQLIGPRVYLQWWHLLKLLLMIVPATVFVVVAFAQVLAGGSIGDVLGEAIAATITATVHVCFWVTLVFAIIDRSGGDTGLTWDVDQLPEPREEHPGRADLIASLVFLGLVLAALVWDQLPGFIRINEESIPILNPALWPWAMIGLLALVGLEIGFAIVLYMRRGWNTTLAVANTALSVIFFSWVMTLLARGELFSEQFLGLAVNNGLNDETLSTLAVVFGFGVATVCLWDIIDGWVKTRRATRLSRAQQQPTTAG